MNKAVFVDKDGTIVVDVGYLSDPEKLKLLPYTSSAIKMFNEANFKVFVISNQSGIARGYLSEDILQTIDKKLQKELLKNGAYVDGIYYCPHHPEEGIYPYRGECECRKPQPGLINKAAFEHGLDLCASYVIGDKGSDIETGKRAGTKTILVLTGKGKETLNGGELKGMKPDHISENLHDAAKWIIGNEEIQTN